MKKTFSKIVVSTLASGMILSAVGPGIVSARVDLLDKDSQENNNPPTNKLETEEVISFSNEEFFKAFEENGYSINHYLTEDEIEQALAEDRANTSDIATRGTTIVSYGENEIRPSSTGGYDIYLSSSITRLAVTTGAGTAAAALLKVPVVGPWLINAGITSGKLTAGFAFLTKEGIGSIDGSIIVLDSNLVPVYGSILN